MADNTVSQVAPFVNENSTIHIDFLNGETPVVSSFDVARHFQRRHSHILRDIDRLRSILPKFFFEPNFGLIEAEVAVGFGIRKNPAYLLTRDAFSLLVMGMTGKAAIMWKLRYIEAFNALEAAALDRQTELAREAGYMQGREETLALPAVKKERQAGYLAGMKEGEKLQKRRDGLRQLMRIRAYREKGLTQAEIGRILGISRDAVKRRMKRAREMGVAI